MKRFFAWILCAILLLFAVGCGQKQEPLPYTDVTFASESDAKAAMMRFFDENWALLMAIKDDLRSPEHGYIENGVVYPVEDGKVLWDSPCSEWPDSIQIFLSLPQSSSCAVRWDDETYSSPVFLIGQRWTNDNGYYSTELVYAEDSDVIRKIMYEEKGCLLEPVYEDAWGVYTVLWKAYAED